MESLPYEGYGRYEAFFISILSIFQTFLSGQLISYSDTAMFGFYGVCADADSGHDGALHNNRLQAVSYAFQGELKRWAHGFG